MKPLYLRIAAALTVLSLAILACSTFAPNVTANPTTSAPQQGNATGGTKIVSGSVTYTNAFFTSGVAEPEIILEDQGGFVTRDRKFIIPVKSQVIGQITSDFYTSPFTYSLTLPEEPNGTLHDVDHDSNQDTGVMVFAIAYWTNTWGDPYLERRDLMGGAWSSAYASTRVSDNPASYLEVFGGKYLVYAPDDQQQFPSGFGADKKLFTDDDPIMNLAAGWSVIDMDQSPFAVDRSEKPTIDLIEPESTALDDFSKLSYTEAFDKMLEKFTNEYAFTELKGIDWAAKGKEFRPRFEEAEKNNDPHAYALALRDFLWSIPDTHVGFDQSLLQNDFVNETAGGLGFAMRETDDGKIIANFILSGGPADQAGMKWGAEIFRWMESRRLKLWSPLYRGRRHSVIQLLSDYSNCVMRRDSRLTKARWKSSSKILMPPRRQPHSPLLPSAAVSAWDLFTTVNRRLPCRLNLMSFPVDMATSRSIASWITMCFPYRCGNVPSNISTTIKSPA